MEQGKVHIDDLYRNMEHALFRLPATAWSDMQPRLDAGPPPRPFPYRWIWYLSSLILLSSFSYYLLKSHSHSDQKDASPTTKLETTTVGQNAESISESAGQEPVKKSAGIPGAGKPKMEKTFRQNGSSDYRPLAGLHPQTPAKHSVLPTGGEAKTGTSSNEKLPLSSDRETATKHATSHTTLFPSESSQHSAHSSPGSERSAANPGPEKLSHKNAASDSAVLPASASRHIISVAQRPGPARPASIPGTPAIRPADPSAAGKKDVLSSPPAPVNPVSGTQKTNHPVADKPLPAKTVAATAAASEHSQKKASGGDAVSAMPKDSSTIISPLSNNAAQAKTFAGTDSISKSSKSRGAAKISAGLKMGYEHGFKTTAIDKFVIAPFLQYRLPGGFSISLQPSIKTGTAKGIATPDAKQYYRLKKTTVDTQEVLVGGKPFNQYTFRQEYDSITVGYATNTKSLELEIPVIIRYHLKNGISLGGGVSFSSGRLVSINEHQQSVNLTQTAVFTIEKAGVHPPPDTSHSFHHSAQPYSLFSPLAADPANPVRIGYLLCLGYAHNHWDLELSMQQAVSGISGITNPDIKEIYQQPYFRLMLGYRLWKK